jgi:uncharacterized protein (DUF952 family)
MNSFHILPLSLSDLKPVRGFDKLLSLEVRFLRMTEAVAHISDSLVILGVDHIIYAGRGGLVLIIVDEQQIRRFYWFTGKPGNEVFFLCCQVATEVETIIQREFE